MKETIENHQYEKIGYGFPQFSTREDIFDIPNGNLSNDTLTFKCEIWKAIHGKNDVDSLKADGDVPLELINSIDWPDNDIVDSDLFKHMRFSVTTDDSLNLRNQLGYNRCMAVTYIDVGNKSILWPIKRFSELHPGKKMHICIPSLMKAAPSFFLTLYLSQRNAADLSVQIEIRTHPNGSKESHFVKCKIVAFNAMSRDRCVQEDEHFFVPNAINDVWKFPEFIDVKKFKKTNCFSSSQDIMYLRFEFSFTRSEGVSHVEKTDIIPFSSNILFTNDNNSSGPLFRILCDTDEFSDVIIRTGDYEFKAHKMVLSAQSNVFKAMFVNDMTEKQNGVVDITDIEESILDSLLNFLYGKDLKINSQIDAQKLYSASDKYEILSLKWLCSNYLKCNLSVSNVCSVLILANLYQDDDLMDEVKRFIHLHAIEIFNSVIWSEFVESNCKLAADIMLNAFKNLNK